MSRKTIEFCAMDSDVEMGAFTLPKICNPLGPVKLNLMDNPHLEGLTLADSVQVDVQVEANRYY